jgi:hypothetical protein
MTSSASGVSVASAGLGVAADLGAADGAAVGAEEDSAGGATDALGSWEAAALAEASGEGDAATTTPTIISTIAPPHESAASLVPLRMMRHSEWLGR